ncbi:non-ribosomal peptide synthetase [Bacillus wiedmannii]|uniref:non-ribosomal peptide synthetase n=1 Tax=Bacillus wiedmannii TaxID=1890302 RepID=UPI001D0EE7E5|nr:non-ribosomal peptide synthetase [Bacillus wiedmannii]MCC2329068.1 amino acid adenylation domain-containing protein [Bacillus wiedmannii]
MDALEFISLLRERGIRIYTDGENIYFVDTNNQLTSEEKEIIEYRSEQLIKYLVEEGEEYLKSEFVDIPLYCEIPSLSTSVKNIQNSHVKQAISIKEREINLLKKQGLTNEVNLPDIFLAAWGVLLHRYTSQENIVILKHQELHEGNVCPVPVRLLVNGEVNFNDLAKQVTHNIKCTENYCISNIELMKKILDVENSDCFNISYYYEENAQSNVHFDNDNTDVALVIKKSSEGTQIEVVANSKLFSKDQINRLLGHLKTIIKKMTLNFQQNVNSFSILTEKEKKQFEKYQGMKRKYPFNKNLVTLFEEQVEKTPEKTALIFHGEDGEIESLNYLSLNRMANYLAYELKQKGIMKGTPIGVYVDRSLHTFIALLGIFKAGGVYVPLDSSYPTDYILQITEEVGMNIFLTKERLRELLPTEGKEIIYLDSIKEYDVPAYDQNSNDTLNSHNLSLIMYTSGSTGIPKGVKHKQIQLINRFRWMWEEYPFKEGDVMCQRTALNFMPSMWELLGGLLKGVPTVIIPDKIVTDPDRLLEVIQKHRITYMMAVPSLLKMMFQSSLNPNDYLSSIRICITAGEPLTLEVLNQFRNVVKDATLINDLGATEVNGVLYFDTTDLHGDLYTSLPTLRPIANVNVYILDQYLQQLPIGVPGDIYISGAPLSLGYVNRPDLDKESFISIPHISTKDKFYKLGDTARFLPDGSIENLGRKDHQVKIRGKRVEIGHIEAVLNQNIYVLENVVVAKKTKKGINRLHAYVVTKPEIETNVEEIKIYLASKLPDYMIPFKVEIIDSIPRRPNGKIDRKALIDRKNSYGFVDLEKVDVLGKLKHIAAKVLEIQESDIEVTKKFYEIGFDSVSIVEFSKEINCIFDIKVIVTELYDNSSLEELANFVISKRIHKDKSLTDIHKSKIEDVIFTPYKEEKTSYNEKEIVDENILYSQLIETLRTCAAGILEINERDVSLTNKFYEVGFDSVTIVEFSKQITNRIGVEIGITDLYDCNSLKDLAMNIISIQNGNSKVRVNNQKSDLNTSEPSTLKESDFAEIDNSERLDGLVIALKEYAAEILEVKSVDINIVKKFYEIGFDSITIVEFAKCVQEKIECDLQVTDLYDCNNLVDLAKFLILKNQGLKQNTEYNSKNEKRFSEITDLTFGKRYKRNDKYINLLLCQKASEVLEIPLSEVKEHKKFYEIGFDSVTIVEFVEEINKELVCSSISITDIYNYPTILDMVDFLFQNEPNYTFKNRNQLSSNIVDDESAKLEENYELLVTMLKKQAAIILGVKIEDIDETLEYGELGFNSIDLTKYLKNLNEVNHLQLSISNLIKLSTIKELAEYLAINGKLKDQKDKEWTSTVREENVVNDENRSEVEYKDEFVNSDIAIVGMSGQFPGASNTYQFWNNLKKGTSAIQEVPEERWSIQGTYDLNPQVPNKTNSKWGGFISDIDKFDPLFFNISQYEAKLMDPQQRLCLEEAWKAIENSGYSDRTLYGKKVGTFVGLRNGDYSKKIESHNIDVSSYTLMGNDSAILSARLAYLLNLKGPTISIDTACSSSLVAIHLACQSILSGDSEMALAGGVNIMTTPSLYVTSSKLGMLSPDGSCKTFDNRANGFVPGEAVGFVVLKKLQDAIQDGDYIHAVIKGSYINQDGKTNGITAPSVESQVDLIKTTLNKFKIDPKTITMVEAHGTGTKLGDPIEVKALTKAFQDGSNKNQYCAIGSVKTNIGHAVAGAGIASLTKVILSLKHKQIPKSLNYITQNEHINFLSSPFYVNTVLNDWKISDEMPRRASISSFGFSGTNCYMVVEEAPTLSNRVRENEPYYLITLSAKNESTLKQKVIDFSQWILSEGFEYNLANISYTLLNGRSIYSHRLAFVVKNLEECLEILNEFSMGLNNKAVYYGNVEENISNVINNIDKGLLALERIRNGRSCEDLEIYEDLTILAKMFVQANDLNWDSIYSKKDCKKVPLPTYPFQKSRYWIEETENTLLEEEISMDIIYATFDRKEKGSGEYRFFKTFSEKDVFANEHTVNGQKIIPGAMCIDLIREIVKTLYNQDTFTIKNLFWINPIFVNQAVEVEVRVIPNGEKITCEIKSKDIIHAKAFIILNTFKVNSLNNNYSNATNEDIFFISKEECYQVFRDRKIKYGKAFQIIEKLEVMNSSVLAYLTASKEEPKYNVCIIDSVFQAAVGLSISETDSHPYMPFSVDELNVFGSLCEGTKVIVQQGQTNENVTGTRKYDIYLLNKDGIVLMSVLGFTQRVYKEKINALQATSRSMLHAPCWREREEVSVQAIQQTVIVLDIDNVLTMEQIKIASSDVDSDRILLVKPSLSYKRIGQNEFTMNITNKEQYIQLFTELNHMSLKEASIVCVSNNSLKNTNESLKVYEFMESLQALLKSKNKLIQYLYIFLNGERVPIPEQSAMAGLLHVLEKEYSGFKGKVVELKYGSKFSVEQELLRVINKELFTIDDYKEIRYENQKRFVKQYERLVWEPRELLESNFLREQGVYIITGGSGGLGQIFAEYLAKTVKAHIVLTGRTEYNSVIDSKVKYLESLGAKVSYFKSDIVDRIQVEKLVQFTKEKFQTIHGIFHCAGVVIDSLFRNKDLQKAKQVIETKVCGATFLDEATKNENMDFFILCSSIAPLLGNIGQSDYAYANNFLDVFAEKRDLLKRRGIRQGKTLSINWPLWKEGGMHMDSTKKEYFQNTVGLHELETDHGIQALKKAMTLNHSQVVVTEGDEEKINHLFNNKPSIVIEEASKNIHPLQKYVEQDLLKLAQQILITNKRIDLNVDLAEYGLNSITITEFCSLVNKLYGLEVVPSVFFEYPTLEELVNYLCNEHYDALEKHYPKQIECFKSKEDIEEVTYLPEASLSSNRMADVSFEYPDPLIQEDPIAIIGLDAIMPGASSAEEFWGNLVQGEESISEIPLERWNWKDYYGNSNEGNKTRIKRGGFIRDIDKFDSMFFGISPKEAQMMDPQQKLLLETTWNVLEDAGYKASTLSGKEIGVFVGAFTRDYDNLLIKSGVNEGHTVAGNDHSILANRISYSFNFKGPSEAVDTACSSSLVCLHRAVQSIKYGECELAVVAGVNALLSPDGFIRSSKAGMLSTEGSIRSFDKNADGYLRGEGCGVLLLKPLSKAKKDRDHIYAVVKGSAVNHSGKGYGLTTPSLNGQAEVIVKALKNAGVSPETIGYIEAHGTASELGDSIEINAFKKAFAQLSNSKIDSSYCGIGSVKPNIGHLEAASGIASLIKTILALKYKKIPKTINFKELNSQIDLNKSPFYIVKELEDWNLFSGENGGNALLRRAGVHSFGFGGTNAHIVLEEYLGENSYSYDGPSLIILSANTKKTLKKYVETILEYIKSHKNEINLANLAYTLQVGRESMNERLAFSVTDLRDLLIKCEQYLNSNDEGLENTFSGNVEGSEKELEWLIDEGLMEEIMAKAIKKRDIEKLARLWTRGIEIPWEDLYLTQDVTRIPLPTYPFEKERFWFWNDVKPRNSEELAHSIDLNSRELNKVMGNDVINQTTIKKTLFTHISQLLGVLPEKISSNKPLLAYGFDSIMAMKLKYLLEQEYSFHISMELLAKSNTIDVITELIVNKNSTKSAVSHDLDNMKQDFVNGKTDLRNVDESTLNALFDALENK